MILNTQWWALGRCHQIHSSANKCFVAALAIFNPTMNFAMIFIVELWSSEHTTSATKHHHIRTRALNAKHKWKIDIRFFFCRSLLLCWMFDNIKWGQQQRKSSLFIPASAMTFLFCFLLLFSEFSPTIYRDKRTDDNGVCVQACRWNVTISIFHIILFFLLSPIINEMMVSMRMHEWGKR